MQYSCNSIIFICSHNSVAQSTQLVFKQCLLAISTFLDTSHFCVTIKVLLLWHREISSVCLSITLLYCSVCHWIFETSWYYVDQGSLVNYASYVILLFRQKFDKSSKNRRIFSITFYLNQLLLSCFVCTLVYLYRLSILATLLHEKLCIVDSGQISTDRLLGLNHALQSKGDNLHRVTICACHSLGTIFMCLYYLQASVIAMNLMSSAELIWMRLLFQLLFW